MNCIELFEKAAREKADQLALWFGPKDSATFGELGELARRTQTLCQRVGIQAGDTVLLMDNFGVRLYAALIGVVASGAKCIFVEPWMAVSRIDHVVGHLKPKLFISSWIGSLWGLRVPAVRKIRYKYNIARLGQLPDPQKLNLESVDPDLPAIITFTSGTTGKPKGVVRTHQYLRESFDVLVDNLELSQLHGPDLCIFANFALINLAAGRASLIVPPKWPTKFLQSLDDLPKEMQPESTTCGPAFLKHLLDNARLSGLKEAHIGGALTDCHLFERAFAQMPHTHWKHLYGSSEAEPVAVGDAREAVKRSREDGFFQTLYLGTPIKQISYQFETNGVWVAGPNVCPKYVMNQEENKLHKREDNEGRLWHFMGDRIQTNLANGRGLPKNGGSWWYAGRSQQSIDDFLLEQRVYSELRSSESFVHRTGSGDATLVGVGITNKIRHKFPEIKQLAPVKKIHRDPRHRARINRKLTLEKEASWLNS